MPSPWLMARASGFYCRVFVPADLRPHIGQRFLVRSLGSRDRDHARLLAARYALAIGDLYRQLRQELSMPEPKVEDIIKAIQSGGTRDLIRMGKMTFPNGAVIEGLEVDTQEELESVVKHANAAAPAPAPGPYRFSPAHGVLASERAKQFCDHLSNTHGKYQAATRRALQMLIDICGDRAPDDYDSIDIDHFEKRIKLLPKNPEKIKVHRDRWVGRNFAQIANDVELFGGVETIGDETIKGHFERLASFFKFCYERRYMGQPSPVAARVKKDASVNPDVPIRLAFSTAELVAIFDPQTYKSRKLPHSFWPPLIALYTGARCNEIAQLYLDDIVNDDPQHPQRWRIMVRIGPGRTDQRLKNKFSNRSIPLHRRLIDLGFIDYLNDVRALGFDRVFPSLRWTEAAGYGDTVSDSFSGYLRDKVKITDPLKVLHSFRHYFCDQANNLTQYDQPRIFDLTGHKREGVFNLSYAKELHWDTKLAILNDIPLPTLDVPVYVPGMFTKNLKATKERQRAKANASEAIKDNHAKVSKGAAKKMVPIPSKTPEGGPKPFSIKATRRRVARPSGA
ncbi:MAG TPA: site-specific integrase [Polaromonas sp.]|uniref:site-specific integrase n=1 Tax=Polaromonas sp. TaxID=1869339 RepID=UPI002D4A6606|nr:site-specific integrase [Polaromonas sp.]HYW57459.1 site-specific integrase [Polaromonas sp.]